MDKQNNTEIKNGKLRQKAEMVLIKKLEKSGLQVSSSNNLKLIHELALHQIELEMQNEELKRAKKKAELAEKKFTELYDFAPSGYVTLTREGEITGLNISAEQLLGKERAHLVKSSFEGFVSTDTRTAYNRFLQKTFKTQSKQTCEIKLVTGNGAIKYVLVNGIISNINEDCLVTLVDMTKQKKAENELIKARNKAEEGDRLKSAFLANMSHEIRTPMNGILGFTGLLKNISLGIEELQEYISIIEKSGYRMLNIINDIISISKIESSQIEINYSDTDVNEQIADIFTFFKLEAEQKKLQISFKKRLPKKDALISTDQEKVYAVLTNLVKNAIKFTWKGSIEIGCEVKGKFLEFFVKDSGQGIPDDEIEIIFERFRRSRENSHRDVEGAGLGLSISKAYVEMLGGKIWVENNTGLFPANGNYLPKGATFFFTIPILPPEESARFNPQNLPNKQKKGGNKKLKVLIVEDDNFSEMVIAKMIDEFAREILKATTGIEAVEICRNNFNLDLVLMDINLPEMDGYNATRKIREFNRDVVIIAQTAYALTGDREKSLAAGCNDYISKPISRIELREKVNHYFN